MQPYLQNGRALVSDIRAARERWEAVVAARSDSSIHRAKDLLMKSPLVTVASLANQSDISEAAASRTIARLVDSGVLTKASGSARYRIWQADEILAALDAFAERPCRGR